MSGTLFPTRLCTLAWSEFPAAGFPKPAAGLLYDGYHPYATIKSQPNEHH